MFFGAFGGSDRTRKRAFRFCCFVHFFFFFFLIPLLLLIRIIIICNFVEFVSLRYGP